MPLLENVKLRGNSAAQQGLIEQHAVHDRDRFIIGSAEEKCRRSLRRDLGFIGELVFEHRIRLFSQQMMQRAIVGDARLHADDGVSEHHKVGATAGMLNRIGRIRIAVIEMRARGGSEMAAGRKSHDADAVWIDGVFVGVGTHVADSSLGIE